MKERRADAAEVAPDASTVKKATMPALMWSVMVQWRGQVPAFLGTMSMTRTVPGSTPKVSTVDCTGLPHRIPLWPCQWGTCISVQPYVCVCVCVNQSTIDIKISGERARGEREPYRPVRLWRTHTSVCWGLNPWSGQACYRRQSHWLSASCCSWWSRGLSCPLLGCYSYNARCLCLCMGFYKTSC